MADVKTDDVPLAGPVSAIPWYQSRTILLLIAGVLLAVGNKLGLLPKELTQDNLADFLMWVVPILLAIITRARTSNVIVSSKAKADDVNSGILPLRGK